MHPLDGIKVLDLSRILAGPWCTQTLADLGADVWKVEAPGRGDDTRTWMPPSLDGESTYFMAANRSKRSIAVDFANPDGQALLRRLAAQADVVVENFRLGGLARYGLDYESLSALNPRLVYCSISGYGRTGPRAAEAGYDFVVQAESGLMAITGEPDGEPMKLGVAIADLVTGMNAVQAILAALVARSATGRGQHIDLALLDGAVAALANVASGHLTTGGDPGRYGNAHASLAPYQLFPASDGAFALAVGNDGQFRRLCAEVIARPELADDPRFATNPGRTAGREAMVEALGAAFRERPVGHWLAELRRHGIPCGRVRSVPEALAAPEIEARGLIHEMDDARHGRLRLMGSPLALADTPPRAPTAPPRLGEHTDAILREVLDAGDDEIARLRAAGAVA